MKQRETLDRGEEKVGAKKNKGFRSTGGEGEN